jgi:hypothetical protein
MTAGVLDAAGNSSSSPPTKVLYLDNMPPWVDIPWVDAPTGAYKDLVYVRAEAWEDLGFIKEVQHSFIHTATGTTEWSGTVASFTANEKKRNFQTVYVLDLSGWSEGWYECRSVATDWAGNITTNTMGNCFEILPVVEMDPFNPVTAKVNFAPLATGQYQATVVGGRLVDGAGIGIPGRDVWIDVSRNTWDPVLSAYQSAWWYGSMVTTGPAGEIPPIGPIVDPNMIFGETEMARVYYYLNMPWQQLGTLRAYLNSPMDGSPPLYQVFEQARSMVDNLDIVMAPSGTTHFTLSLTGNLVRNNGDPVAGATMRIHSQHEEPVGIWNDQDFTDSTGPAGEFDFSYPADNLRFPVDVWVNIDFYDDRGDFIGQIQYDPFWRSWRRWFW